MRPKSSTTSPLWTIHACSWRQEILLMPLRMSGHQFAAAATAAVSTGTTPAADTTLAAAAAACWPPCSLLLFPEALLLRLWHHCYCYLGTDEPTAAAAGQRHELWAGEGVCTA